MRAHGRAGQPRAWGATPLPGVTLTHAGSPSGQRGLGGPERLRRERWAGCPRCSQPRHDRDSKGAGLMPCVDCSCLWGGGGGRGREGQGLTPVHQATTLLCCGSGKGPRGTPCPSPPLSGPRALALSCPPLPQTQEAKPLTLALPVPPFPTTGFKACPSPTHL